MMTWEAFYAPWDVIRNKRVLTALCIIFDRINILGLQWGDYYPNSVEEVIQFELKNYQQVRLGDVSQFNAIKRWHLGLRNKAGFNITLEELIEVDRTILLKYAIDWYPFYNYITPLAEGDNPVLVSVEPEIDPVKYRLLEKLSGSERTSIEHIKYCSVKNRELGIEFEMIKACKKANGILVYDKPLLEVDNFANYDLVDLVSPLMAEKCLEIFFPCNNVLFPEEILEVRFKLFDELNEFRSNMTNLSLFIIEYTKNNPNIEIKKLTNLLKTYLFKLDIQ